MKQRIQRVFQNKYAQGVHRDAVNIASLPLKAESTSQLRAQIAAACGALLLPPLDRRLDPKVMARPKELCQLA